MAPSAARIDLRDFTPDDYPAIAHVYSSAYPDYPSSADELRFRDSHRDPKCLFHRWVAVDQGQVIAFGEHDQHSMMYHPRKFHFDLTVLPERWGQGVGRALYDRVLAGLAVHDPLVLRTMAREVAERSFRFLSDRGYSEDRRLWESRLDPASIDLAPYEQALQSVRAQGIEIKTFRELETDPDRMQKIADLDWEATQDVPLSEPATRMPDDVYIKSLLENPNLIPDAFLVAVDHGRYAGLTTLWASQESDDLYTGFTATARAYRRRGIALALKVTAIAWAKAQGAPCIKTWNDSTNRPMLSINEALGFVRQPAWVLYRRTVKEEAPIN